MKGESLFHCDAEQRGHRFLSYMSSEPEEKKEEGARRKEVQAKAKGREEIGEKDWRREETTGE